MVNHLQPTPFNYNIYYRYIITKNSIFYILFKCKRALNKRTNLGNIYLVNIYIINISKVKLNITWFTKKNGINWGIFL